MSSLGIHGGASSGGAFDGNVLSVIPGTGATNLGKAEDAPHSSGDVGVMALAVRREVATDFSNGATDSDYVPLQVNGLGSLRVVMEDAIFTLASIVQPTTSSSGTLDALDEVVSVYIQGGARSAGGRVDAGTFEGTLSFEHSYDSGVTWTATTVSYDGSQIIAKTLTNPNAASGFTFYLSAFMTNVRVRVSAYTSGSVVVLVRTSMLADSVVDNSTALPPSTLASFARRTLIGGTDTGAIVRGLLMGNALPSSTAYGAVVREAAQGQTTMASSRPVVLASDQTEIPVTKTSLLYASGQTSASGNTTVVTPSSGKKVRLAYLSYSPATAIECAYRFGASGTLFLRNPVPATGIVAKDFGDFRYIEGATDEALVLNLTGAVTTTWNVFYTETT